MVGELRAFDRAAVVPPEDLAELLPGGQLYALFDPELEAPEVTTLGSERQGCVWVYSSVELLVESCGDGQPYIAVTPPQVLEFAEAVEGVTLLAALDARHPDGARHPAPEPEELESIELMKPEATEPLVWIPTFPVRAGDRQVIPELYGRRPGEKLLMLFDSKEQAWQACGPYQPLSAIHLDNLDAVVRDSGADVVVAGNGVVAEEAQHTGPVHDWRR